MNNNRYDQHPFLNTFSGMFNKVYYAGGERDGALSKIWKAHGGSQNLKVQAVMDEMLTLASQVLKENPSG